MTIDELVSKLYPKIDKRYVVIFLTSVITGLMAHGLALFNKYSFHDDVYSMFTVGATFSSGRYMLYEISYFIQTMLGGLFSTPLYEGMITIIFISFSCILIISLLDIKSKVVCSAVASFMVCFPVVTGMLGFMFTGCYYAVAIFFTILGSFLICKYKKWYGFIAGVLLIGNAIGIYQAYIPLFLSMFLLCYLKENLDMRGENNKRIFLYIPYYTAASMASIVIYFLTNSFELHRYGKELSSYKGIDKMGQMTIEQFIERLKLAYSRFFFPKQDLFPKITYKLYMIIVCICILLSAFLIVYKLRGDLISILLSTVTVILIPFGFNFAYIMINEEQSVGTLQSYGYVMVIVWIALLLDQIEVLSLKYSEHVCIASLMVILLTSLTYVRLDNIVYLKAEILKQRSLAYYTELITQIKNVDGYSDDLPITYIKNGDIDDSTIQEIPVWDFFYVHPYCETNYNINYAWWGYISYWLGFNAERVDATPFEEMDEVTDMPSYPDDGSIKIINGTVVVKLADEKE